jgi:mannosyl-3-phosphoglycerate phosphatase
LKTKTVVFADLDGAFLDETYDCKDTKPIVSQLAALGSAIVFCSSKTRSEIEYYRKTMHLNEPFISENGSAIFIPKNYFPQNYLYTRNTCYSVIRLGTSYGTLRQKLAKITRETAAKIVGFGDMNLEELVLRTGLPLNLAKLAKNREHDEPFRIINGNRSTVFKAIKKEGLKCTEGGRWLHLTGNTDKGKAVAILKSLYCQTFGKIETFGVGDGPNDLSMLKIVDKPFLIKKKTDVNSSFDAWKGILQLIAV